MSDPVPVELTQAESYTAEIVEIRKDLALVEGVVLPPLPEKAKFSFKERARLSDLEQFEPEHVALIVVMREQQLAEAIAQRDAAQRQNSIVNAENQRIREAGRTRITELEAALATERARADKLQETLNGSIQIGKDAAKSFLDSKK